MDFDMSSPTQENEPKAEFRKLTNEAASRKYRRRSPVSGSSDGEGSPKRDYMSRGISKASNYDRRNSDKLDDGSSGHSQRGCSGDSYRHSSRGDRHDEHSRHGKHSDEDGRTHAISFRSRRDSKGGTNSDYRDQESEYNSSRDCYRDVNRCPRDKSDRTRHDGRHGGRYSDLDRYSREKDYHRDEKMDYRSFRDRRDDRPYGNSTGRQTDSGSIKETGDMKDVDDSKDSQEKSENEELVRHEDRRNRIGRSDDRSAVSEESAAKRPKFSLGNDFRKGSEQGEDHVAKKSPEQPPVSGADSVSSVDAAEVAAMKAAQIVNQNLTSTSFMTADQKKKLLWGNKKSSGAEETPSGSNSNSNSSQRSSHSEAFCYSNIPTNHYSGGFQLGHERTELLYKTLREMRDKGYITPVQYRLLLSEKGLLEAFWPHYLLDHNISLKDRASDVLEEFCGGASTSRQH